MTPQTVNFTVMDSNDSEVDEIPDKEFKRMTKKSKGTQINT
jgi:hypothetical protein